MYVYVFDNTFDGFLTCIYESYYNKIKPDSISIKESYTNNLIDIPLEITTDIKKSSKVYISMEKNFTNQTLKNIFNVFLSNNKNKYWILYNYIRLAFKFKSDVDMYLNNSFVLDASKISKSVQLEAHKFTGFVRFKEFETNKFYASIEPDNNILVLLSKHFVSRFSNQYFIIHDIKRNLALIYNCNDYFITELDGDYYKKISTLNDSIYENLWKNYFSSASIDSRKNPRLQCRQMPKKYWKHILETQK